MYENLTAPSDGERQMRDVPTVSYWELQELYPRISPPTVVRVLDEQRFVEQ